MQADDNKVVREIRAIRDMVESVWVAIVLAFVLRAFMVEAFVIPTGSMAPRLMGRHYDMRCPSCGYRFAYGYGGENTGPKPIRPPKARCPNCYYRGTNAEDRFEPVFAQGGDRVLVLKYLYQFSEPQAWDVVVFRNPQDNHQNYIKRLVGLPGETLEIVHGDIFVHRNGSGGAAPTPWQIRRKPDRAQDAMWQIVFDNDYRPDEDMLKTINVIWPRWKPGAGSGWDTAENGRAFTYEGDREGHLTFDAPRDRYQPHYAYNTYDGTHSISPRMDICTDLKLSAVFTPEQTTSSLEMLLTSFEHRFRGVVSADGTASLHYHSPAHEQGQWKTWTAALGSKLTPGAGREVSLEHADFRVTLRVDGEPVLRVDSEAYEDEELYGKTTIRERLVQRLTEQPGRPAPTPEVKFIARGGGCSLTHLRLMRDVYYTNTGLDGIGSSPADTYARKAKAAPSKARNDWSKEDLAWGVLGNPIRLLKNSDDPDLDEFFVLGDNSPQSLDGRAWTKAAPTLRLYDKDGNALYQLGTVPRYAMIGRALFVYWPAGFRLPGLSLPIVPNVGRMRLIR